MEEYQKYQEYQDYICLDYSDIIQILFANIKNKESSSFKIDLNLTYFA